MQYPKRFMTITELVNLGFGRKALNKWVHIKGCPVIRNGKRGMHLIDTSKLDNFMIRKGFLKRDVIKKSLHTHNDEATNSLT